MTSFRVKKDCFVSLNNILTIVGPDQQHLLSGIIAIGRKRFELYGVP
jgi:hypothetical protein